MHKIILASSTLYAHFNVYISPNRLFAYLKLINNTFNLISICFNIIDIQLILAIQSVSKMQAARGGLHISRAGGQVGKEVYRGYMPPGLPQHRPRNRVKPWHKVMGRPRVSISPPEIISGYSDEPEYPQLNKDGSSFGCSFTQKRLDWYELLKNLPTCEQKMEEISKQTRHYVAHLNNWLPVYNGSPFSQYLTQTHMINSLPESYQVASKDTEQIQDEDLVVRIRDLVLAQIELELFKSIRKQPKFVTDVLPISGGRMRPEESNRVLHNIFNSVKRVISLEMNPELTRYQVDLSPAMRSWFYHSGFEPPNGKIFYKIRKDDKNRINQVVQLDGSSALNLRGEHSLEPILSQDDPLVNDSSLVSEFCHPMKNFGAIFKFKTPVSLAGYWPDESKSRDFPHTCFLTTDCLAWRNRKSHFNVKLFDDDEISLNNQALLTQFGWLNTMALYHGFTTFQELEYPFTSQAVTTNGQNWLFNVYQMNNHSFHRDFSDLKKKNNICWSSGLMQLYESYEDGQFKGLNDEPIKLLIKFLSRKTNPEYTSQLNLRPYLGEDTRTDEEKEEMRKEIRRLYGNKGEQYTTRHWQRPLWEHLFFRSKEGRNRIRHLKAPYHPKFPEYPRIFL